MQDTLELIHCAKCGELTTNVESMACIDCIKILGRRPHDCDDVCYTCGDNWIISDHIVCFDCFKESDGINTLAI